MHCRGGTVLGVGWERLLLIYGPCTINYVSAGLCNCTYIHLLPRPELDCGVDFFFCLTIGHHASETCASVRMAFELHFMIWHWCLSLSLVMGSRTSQLYSCSLALHLSRRQGISKADILWCTYGSQLFLFYLHFTFVPFLLHNHKIYKSKKW